MLFLHPALAQTRDCSRSNYTCAFFFFLFFKSTTHQYTHGINEAQTSKTETDRQVERQADRQTDRETEGKVKMKTW